MKFVFNSIDLLSFELVCSTYRPGIYDLFGVEAG